MRALAKDSAAPERWEGAIALSRLVTVLRAITPSESSCRTSTWVRKHCATRSAVFRVLSLVGGNLGRCTQERPAENGKVQQWDSASRKSLFPIVNCNEEQVNTFVLSSIQLMATSRRVLIFADSDNTVIAAQSFNRKLDWLKIRDYLADPSEGREIIEMVIYVGLPPARERFEEQRKTKEKFIYWARSNGFLVVTREGKAKGDEYESNVDIVMAMDAVELALEMRPDIVVLVTGDSDFAYLAEKLRRRGMRVEVASVEQSLGNELKNAANSTVDLIEIFDKFEPQNNGQNHYRIGNTNLFD